jgi:TRAP-type mannitol/chloroaromatic compound transport system permease small subunit
MMGLRLEEKDKVGKLLSIINKLSFVGLAVAGISLLIMVLVIATEVGVRVFGLSTKLSDQVSGYLLVSLAFMGQAYTLKSEGHIRIDIIYSRLPARVRHLLDILACLISIPSLAYCSWSAWLVTLRSYTTGTTSAQPVDLPLYPAQLSMTIGLFFFTLMFVPRIVNLFRRSYWERDYKQRAPILPTKE